MHDAVRMVAKTYSCSCLSSYAFDSHAEYPLHPIKPSLQQLQTGPLWLQLVTPDSEKDNHTLKRKRTFHGL
jgi:hypothetical protein